MKAIVGLGMALLVALVAVTGARAADGKIAIVAAENFYGDVAQQIGGDQVSVVSILSNPDQDPHLFETAPSVVREVAAAKLVVYNGADYDPWMERLLEVTPKPGRVSDRSRGSHAQKGRRQSAPLVRSVDDADGGQGAVGGAQRGRSRPR